MLKVAINEGDLAEALLSAKVVPLYDDEERRDILDSMPRTNARGLVTDAAQPAKGEAPGLGGAEWEAPASEAAGAGDAIACAEPSTSEERGAIPAHGRALKRGKRRHLVFPVVEIPSSSSSSPPSCPPPPLRNAGQGCLTAMGTGLSSGRASSPKQIRLRW